MLCAVTWATKMGGRVAAERVVVGRHGNGIVFVETEEGRVTEQSLHPFLVTSSNRRHEVTVDIESCTTRKQERYHWWIPQNWNHRCLEAVDVLLVLQSSDHRPRQSLSGTTLPLVFLEAYIIRQKREKYNPSPNWSALILPLNIFPMLS